MSVPEYWRKVLSGAWDRTYNPLGWNAKKVAVVLIAVGTIVAADVRLGLAAMITSAVGYLSFDTDQARRLLLKESQ